VKELGVAIFVGPWMYIFKTVNS